MENLSGRLRAAAEQVIPRFLSVMPPSYFAEIDSADQTRHLEALVAIEASGQPQEMMLRSDDGQRITFVNERSYPGQLAELVRRLPDDPPLHNAKIFTANDNRLVVDVFELGQRAKIDPQDQTHARYADAIIAYAADHAASLSPDTLRHFLTHCSAEYLQTMPPARACRDAQLIDSIIGTDDTQVEIHLHNGEPKAEITIAVGNAERRSLFQRVAKHLGTQGIDILQARLDTIDDAAGSSVSLLVFEVAVLSGDFGNREAVWHRIERDLQRITYLDDGVLELAYQLRRWTLQEAEVLAALCRLTHQLLAPNFPLLFTREKIVDAALMHENMTHAIIALFLTRVSPGGIHDIDEAANDLAEQVQREIASPDDRRVLVTLIECVRGTLRTNLFVPQRYALSLRVDSKLLSREDRQPDPYGAFFVHGRDFDGFHVRFRDLSRGGVRILKPRSREHYALESERIYLEAYDLAYTQQLKNKDIPEGGAKGVILVTQHANDQACGRAFADALLDLLTTDNDVRSMIVDHYGHDELLYLGPEENVTPELTNWIANRAIQRRYPQPNAFMSGRSGPSVDHRAYGVTSEGVTVFLEAALRHVGIDPRAQSFTLKMTGGPDGDVAGNEIRILHREFGDKALIVGIADVSASAEDPNGLDHDELLRLCDAGEPIANYRPERLSHRGRVIAVDNREGHAARNTMHNRIIADAFIPAGGRPRTINSANWQEFMTSEGRPSSRVIIEGANLFITAKARQRLSQSGVVIIKDSSGNKCGEICTSFEVLASLLLSEGEFLTIKEIFVRQVITRLRELAAYEAAALFREHRHQPDTTLPELSDRLSNVIDYANDAIMEGISHTTEQQRRNLELVLYEYVPQILTERAGDTLLERLSPQYTQRIISTALASRIVYREGMAYLAKMPPEAIAELAIRYLAAELQVGDLVAEVEVTDIPDRERIMAILREAGPTVALRQSFGM